MSTTLRTSLVYERLLEEIEARPCGALLPTVSQMKRQWKVGQATLEKAMERLEAQGRIVRKKGMGILVADSSAPSRTEEVPGILQAFSPWIRTSPATIPCLVSSIEETALWQEWSRAFHRCFPNRRIEVEYLPDHEILKRLQGPHSPTVVELCSGLHFYQPMVEGTLFQDLSLFAGPLRSDSRYHENTFLQDTQGRLVGVAPFLVTEILLINRELWHSSGAHFPEENQGWSAFVEAITSARKALGRDNLWGYQFPGYLSFLVQWGVPFLQPGTRERRLNRPEMKDALEFLRRMIVDQRIAPCYFDLKHRSNPYEEFLEWKALTAQCFSYSLRLPPFREALSQMDMELHLMPLNRKGRRLISGPVFCLDAGSVFYEEGWEFLQFVLSEEGQSIAAKYRCYVPALETVLPQVPGLERSSKGGEDPKKVLRGSATPGFMPFLENPRWLQALPVLEGAVNRWLKEGEDLEGILGRAEELCQTLLSNRRENS